MSPTVAYSNHPEGSIQHLFVRLLEKCGLGIIVVSSEGPRNLLDRILEASPALARSEIREDGLLIWDATEIQVVWAVMRCNSGSIAPFVTSRMQSGGSRTLRTGVIDPMMSLEKWGAAVFTSELGETDGLAANAFASAEAMSSGEVTQSFSTHV